MITPPLVAMSLLSLWVAIYTGSLAVALWSRRNLRGALGTALLAAAVLVIPPLVQILSRFR